MKILVVAVAAATLAAAPALATETLTATFTTPDGGQTVDTYAGQVLLTVSGTGMSNGTDVNDAFYDVVTRVHNAAFYQLTFSTTTLTGGNPAQNAFGRIVDGLPAYSATNTYTFLLNTGATALSTLHFGVGDGQFGDNSGSYTITVSQAPEAATWAMMVGGFGLIGGALRRTRRTGVRFV